MENNKNNAVIVGVEPRVRGIPNDVTDQSQTQRENVESRRMFEDLFDNSDAAIIDFDFSALFQLVRELKRNGVLNLRSYIAGSDERQGQLVGVVRVNNANAAALRMLGVSSKEDLVKQSTNIVDVAEAMLEGNERIRGSEYLTSGGRYIPVVYSLRIPKTEEEARRVLIVIIDLSEVKLAEAARQATIAKSQFLSSMSHEIRTPLNGVIGNLELLALTTIDNEQFELVDDAEKAAKALLGLIGNILDFSKIEAGKLTTEMGDINPTGLVEEAVDVLQSLGRQKNIFVGATFGPNVPTLVRGDAIRVRQILLNLIGNAVKFTERGGVQVTLTATSGDQEKSELRFDVHDSGQGFDQIRAAKLFKPFSQGRTSVDKAEGTGLGLSICKSLVEVFGGTIGCESVPGEGASFWFTLPVTVVIPAPPQLPRPDLSSIRVMVIGRGDNAAQSLENYFKLRGATVIKESHRTALAFVSERNADKALRVDVAVLVPDESDDDASETTQRLRELHVVPLLCAVSRSPRTWLRQGFAAMIPPDVGANYIDRNIRLLVGHVRSRERLAELQDSVASAYSPSLSGKRVLILEDRLLNQTVIQKQLKKLGVDCVLVANGVMGLEMLDRQRFDLILCDCSMPVMNGYEFTQALRRRESAQVNDRRVPVIALTANAFREDVDRCLESGMDDFISKPVTMDRLAAMLLRWLSPNAPAAAALGRAQTDHVGTAPTIDIGALAEILGTNEPEMLNEVLAQFVSVVVESLSNVDAAVSSGDPDRIKAAAHGAKGEARCSAAIGLAGLYSELESQAKNNDRAASQELIARTEVEVRRVERFIRERLGGKVS
jgi:signal transduction histidine kinase/DNA-binding NarL/FixJ family response regulator/HPt (histidine-containing phosphotransfer) domain-containing protein